MEDQLLVTYAEVVDVVDQVFVTDMIFPRLLMVLVILLFWKS